MQTRCAIRSQLAAPLGIARVLGQLLRNRLCFPIYDWPSAA